MPSKKGGAHKWVSAAAVRVLGEFYSILAHLALQEKEEESQINGQYSLAT